MTVTEYGYALEKARDLPGMGMEQCLDQMAAAVNNLYIAIGERP